MRSRGLLQPQDLSVYTPVKLDFNPCSMRQTFTMERQNALACLGADLWNSMRDAQADYSGTSEYNADTVYEAGEIVQYGGLYYVALRQTSAQPPAYEDWALAPKFTGDCAADFDSLWCDYLAPWLSFVVLSERFPYIITQLGDQGMTYGGRKYNIQDEKLMGKLEKAIFRDRENAYQMLVSFLGEDESKTKTCYGEWKGYPDTETDTCGCGGKGCDNCDNARPRHVGGYRFWAQKL